MIRARKRFGQHFLEPAWRGRLVDAVKVAPDDDVVEIGPGAAALTDLLVTRARRVLAIEIDRDLAAALEHRALPTLTVHTGDALAPAAEAALDGWLGRAEAPFRVVGNLPYNVSSPILFMLAGWRRRHPGLRDATVMLQSEVADRLLASPSTKEYGVLTVLMALTAAVDRLLDVPPGAFRPVPKVRSTVVRLRFHERPAAVTDETGLVRIVKAAFGQRRKTLANALHAAGVADGVDAAATIAAAGLDPRRRPETLQLVEFAALADAWRAAAAPPSVL